MWYVFYYEDGSECGWAVKSEDEAKRYCEANHGYMYRYVG